MSDTASVSGSGYQPPEPIEVPPLYAWPPRPLAALRWILGALLFPWGLLFIALAALAWRYLSPDLATLARLEPGWVALLWLRNAAFLTLIAGGLHAWLYIRRAQGQDYKYNPRWPTTGKRKFLQFHHLHHRYFEVNYGNTPTPLDKLFGSWHDGSPAAHAAFRDRRRLRTGANPRPR